MSGFSASGSVLALLYYALPLAAVCLLVGLVMRRLFSGLSLVVVTVVIAEAITILAFASGMAKSDFTFTLVSPFLLVGALIAVAWASALALKARAA